MNSARIWCWLDGHKVRQATAVITEDKKYHGHTTTRKFGKCERCGEGTLENDLSYWDDEKNVLERHDKITATLVACGVVLGFIVACAILVGFGALILFPLSKYMCELNGAEMGLAAKYNYWTGCYLKVEGRWVADELLNVVDLLK